MQSKDKATSKLLQQLLKEMKGVKNVSVLSSGEKEDIALTIAIQKGETGKYIDTDKFLNTLKQSEGFPNTHLLNC
ncbi:MAG: hypothetical protein ABJA79_09695 [Parafilimonas sp.]